MSRFNTAFLRMCTQKENLYRSLLYTVALHFLILSLYLIILFSVSYLFQLSSFLFSTTGQSSSFSTFPFVCFCLPLLGLPPLLFIIISQCLFYLPIKPQLPLVFGPGVWAAVACFTICASLSVSLHSCIHFLTVSVCTPSFPPSLSLCLRHWISLLHCTPPPFHCQPYTYVHAYKHAHNH